MMFEKKSDLLKFLAVVEVGKIQFAAEKMHTTQPALSRTIAKLEDQFGGQLFERMPSGVRLTPFGVTIVQQVRHIVREIEIAEGAIAASVSGQTGELRISAGPMWMRAYLPGVIKKFQEKYPGIQLQLKTKTYEGGIEDLINGHSDLHCGGFDNDSPLPQFLRRERIMIVNLGVMASAVHPIFKKKLPSYDDLADYPWLAFTGENAQTSASDWPSLTVVLDELYEKCGKRASSILRCDPSCLFLMGTAPYLAYLGMNFASKFAGQKLRHVPLDFSPKSFHAGIVTRRSLEATTAFKDFKALLKVETRLHA